MRRKTVTRSFMLVCATLVCSLMIAAQAYALNPATTKSETTWEVLSLVMQITPDLTFKVQAENTYEFVKTGYQYSGNTGYSSKVPVKAGETTSWQTYIGPTYTLKIDDAFKFAIGVEYYGKLSPKHTSYSDSSRDTQAPYEHAAYLWLTPSYKIGDFTLSLRLGFFNQLYEGNTQGWKYSFNTATQRFEGVWTPGYDESEAMGWAMTLRARLGLSYKLTKTTEFFVQGEIYYGLKEDDETKYLQGISEDVIRDGTGRNYEGDGNFVEGDSKIKHGDYFNPFGWQRTRAYVGLNMKLTDSVSFQPVFIHEEIYNTSHNPNLPTQTPSDASDRRYRNYDYDRIVKIKSMTNFLQFTLTYKLDLTK